MGKVSVRNTFWLGSEQRPVVLVDTPGTDDLVSTVTEEGRHTKENEQNKDFHLVVKTLDHVHAFLLLMPYEDNIAVVDSTLSTLDLLARRFAHDKKEVEKQNHGETVLKEVPKPDAEKIAELVDFWNHVVFGITKCNEFQSKWEEVD